MDLYRQHNHATGNYRRYQKEIQSSPKRLSTVAFGLLPVAAFFRPFDFERFAAGGGIASSSSSSPNKPPPEDANVFFFALGAAFFGAVAGAEASRSSSSSPNKLSPPLPPLITSSSRSPQTKLSLLLVSTVSLSLLP